MRQCFLMKCTKAVRITVQRAVGAGLDPPGPDPPGPARTRCGDGIKEWWWTKHLRGPDLWSYKDRGQSALILLEHCLTAAFDFSAPPLGIKPKPLGSVNHTLFMSGMHVINYSDNTFFIASFFCKTDKTARILTWCISTMFCYIYFLYSERTGCFPAFLET